MTDEIEGIDKLPWNRRNAIGRLSSSEIDFCREMSYWDKSTTADVANNYQKIKSFLKQGRGPKKNDESGIDIEKRTKQSIRRKYIPEHVADEKPKRLEEIQIDSPSNIDQKMWYEFSDNSEEEVTKAGRKLQGDSKYVVYCLEVELCGGSVLSTKSEATKYLPDSSHPPGWVHYAARARETYYIGYTHDLATRLKGHAKWGWDPDGGPDTPSKITAISSIKRAAVLYRLKERKAAVEYERAVADKFRTDDYSRFVYQS